MYVHTVGWFSDFLFPQFPLLVKENIMKRLKFCRYMQSCVESQTYLKRELHEILGSTFFVETSPPYIDWYNKASTISLFHTYKERDNKCVFFSESKDSH